MTDLKVTIKVTIELVSPHLAERWLLTNLHNRTMKDAAVRRYAADMLAGTWDENGESIKFDSDGHLVDGQNRLRAITLSGVSVRMVIVRGLRPEAQQTIDVGPRRTLADMLKLRGEVSTIDLAAGITRFWGYQQDPGSSHFGEGPSIHAALDVLRDHPGLRESVRAAEIPRKAVGLRGSVGIALHYITSTIDAGDAEAFWEKLVSGVDLGPSDPIYRLRELLIEDRLGSQRTARMSGPRTWALCVKAWNAYREGREVRLLVWRPGGAHPETFPIPV